jgi:hypothetical protein
MLSLLEERLVQGPLLKGVSFRLLDLVLVVRDCNYLKPRCTLGTDLGGISDNPSCLGGIVRTGNYVHTSNGIYSPLSHNHIPMLSESYSGAGAGALGILLVLTPMISACTAPLETFILNINLVSYFENWATAEKQHHAQSQSWSMS